MSEACHEPPAPLEDENLTPWRDVPRNEVAPFTHRFQTSRGRYVYDVNTRRILRVSSAAWDILDDVGSLDRQQMARKHASVHGPAEIAAALEEIERARQDQGVFLSFRPAAVEPPGRDSVRRQLDEHRSQLILNVTDDCNFRCSYCVYGGAYPQFPRRSSQAMAWEVARPAIDEFLAHSGRAEARTISFYGGEPLLNLSLIRQCVRYARDRCAGGHIRFAMTTNASLLKGEAAELLAAERFALVVSLDGPREIHDRHRRTASGAPSWNLVWKNLQEFLASHPDYGTNGLLHFNAVATRTADLRLAQEFWSGSDLFTDSMGLEVSDQKHVPASPEGLSPQDSLVVSSRALYQDFLDGLKSGRWTSEHDTKRRWIQASVFQRSLAMFHRRKYLSPHLPERMVFLAGCIPGVRRAFLSATGEYFACERVVPCPQQSIGSVQDGILLDKVVALLDRWAGANGEQCRYCWCLSHCNMGCLATADDDGTITEAAKRESCARYRCRMHRLLREYVGVLDENPKALDYTAGFQFL